MLLALSKLPRDPLFPSLSNYAASFRPFPKEAVKVTRDQGNQECVPRVQTFRLRIQRHQELVTQESSPEALGVEGA